MKVQYIVFMSLLSEEYFFCKGILAILDTLSTEKKLEIIRGCMEGV